MIKDIGLNKAVILTAEILSLVVLSYPFCVENMSYDWLMLWITVGIFFEVDRMRLWIIFGTPDTDSAASAAVRILSADRTAVSGQQFGNFQGWNYILQKA